MSKMNFAIDYFEIVQNDKYVMILDCYVVSDGANRHNTFFSLDVINEAYPTIANKPLLALFDGYDFKEHSRNNFDKDQERLIGVVPESNHGSIVQKNGKNWQKVKVIIWKSYNPKLVSRVVFNESTKISMEIDILQSHEREDGLVEIDKYVYLGICLLGQNYMEAVPGAKVDIFKYSYDTQPINNMYFSLVENQLIEIPDNIQSIINNNFQQNPKKKLFSKPNLEYKKLVDLQIELNNQEFNTWFFAISENKKVNIEIDNSKQSSIESKNWSDLGADFYNKLEEASNAKNLINEAYLLPGNNSTNSKYLHHKLKNNVLVVDEKGIIAASSRLNQMKSSNKIDSTEYSKAYKHLMKHRKELEMDKLEKMSRKVGFAVKELMAKLKENIKGKSTAKLFSIDSEYVYAKEDNKMCKYKYAEDGTIDFATKVDMYFEDENVEGKKTSDTEKVNMAIMKENDDLKKENFALKEEKSEREKSDKKVKAEKLYATYKDYLDESEITELNKVLFSYEFSEFESKVNNKVLPKVMAKVNVNNKPNDNNNGIDYTMFGFKQSKNNDEDLDYTMKKLNEVNV